MHNGSDSAEGEANLNNLVWVKITPVGERIWAEYYAKIAQATGEPARVIKRDAEGWTEMQMHKVASMFGSHMVNGQKMPIEMNYRTKRPGGEQ